MRKKGRAQRELRQYFTPQAVAEFALDAVMAFGLGPGRLRVVDPACGEGVFLLEARKRFPEAELWGCDLDASLAPAWDRAGLCGPRVHMRVQDGLADEPAAGLGAGRFDLVAGNPPYGFDVPRPTAGGRIEALFLRRFVELARPGGWLAIVVPEGILANDRSQALRDWFLDRASLAAVVALPEATFAAAGTCARTAVLIARKAHGSTAPALLARPRPGGEGERSLRRYLASVLAAARQRRGTHHRDTEGTDDGLVNRRCGE